MVEARAAFLRSHSPTIEEDLLVMGMSEVPAERFRLANAFFAKVRDALGGAHRLEPT